MVERIAQNFLKIGDPAIATYDWIDLATGVGYQIFYLGATAVSVNTGKYVLTTNPFYSSYDFRASVTPGVTNTTAWDTIHDLDFDLLLSKQLTVGGEATATIATRMLKTGGTSARPTRVTVTFRKWDGSTETDIVSTISEKMESTDATGWLSVTMTIPETIFKKGETMRLNILQEADVGASETYTVGIGHDPKSQASVDGSMAAGTTISEFICPIKVLL